jgi:hypothetical protein
MRYLLVSDSRTRTVLPKLEVNVSGPLLIDDTHEVPGSEATAIDLASRLDLLQASNKALMRLASTGSQSAPSFAPSNDYAGYVFE